MELLARYGVRPSKRLGQNFVVDPNLIAKIVEVSRLEPNDNVVEVGAGTGALTHALAAAVGTVRAFEVDRRLAALLEETVGRLDNVEIRAADVMDIDWNRELEGARWTMVANLPYNVGTPLLMTMLHQSHQPEKFVVMMQREVIDRLTAAPGSRNYGIPSVGAQLFAKVKRVMTVGSQVFFPRPAVQSAVASLERTSGPDEVRLEAYRIARAAFNQRRKMLRVSLQGLIGALDDTLVAAEIDPTARPEDVPVDAFLRLAGLTRT